MEPSTYSGRHTCMMLKKMAYPNSWWTALGSAPEAGEPLRRDLLSESRSEELLRDCRDIVVS